MLSVQVYSKKKKETETKQSEPPQEYTVTDYTSDLTEMAKNVQGSIVRVNGVEKASGFVFGTDNNTIYVVSAASVTDENGKATVTFDSGAQKEGTVLGEDPGTGISVIKVDTDFTASAITRGSADQVDAGEYGAAFGGHDRSVSEGAISFGVMSGVFTDKLNADSAYHTQLIGFDGNVAAESNGGPLCDVSGAVIGMINTDYHGNGADTYAVGISDVKKAYDEIVADGKVSRGALDLSLTNVSRLASYQKNERGMMLDQTDGVIVNQVGDALKDTIREDDVITRINTKDITNMSDVRDVLYGCNSGDELDIVLVRGEEETEVKVIAQ